MKYSRDLSSPLAPTFGGSKADRKKKRAEKKAKKNGVERTIKDGWASGKGVTVKF